MPRPVEAVDDLPAVALTLLRSRTGATTHWRFPLHVISQIRAAGRLLRERHFDLLVFRIDVFPFVPFYLTRRHRLPYVIKTLGTGALDALEKRGWFARLLAPLNRRMFHSLVSRALVADTDSEGHAVALRQRLGLGEREIVWIDNAVNTGRFHPGERDEARRALDLERFDPADRLRRAAGPGSAAARSSSRPPRRLLPRYPAAGRRDRRLGRAGRRA